jgi:prolyl 4-hydroxylase
MSALHEDTPELRQWIIRQTEAGHPPQVLIEQLVKTGYAEDVALALMTTTLESRLAEIRTRTAETQAEPTQKNELDVVVPVPQPIGTAWPSVVRALDRDVHVLFSLNLPRVVLFGGLLSDAECDELVEASRSSMTASNVIDMEGGGEQHDTRRSSTGTAFARGATPLITRIEQRIAALLNWPLENGEALQILRYQVGQEYQPHWDYVDPAQPGSAPFLARGGQRVASLVMYLNTPEDGGATNFPEIGLEVAAVKGNAVFFSYDRPHPSTKTLHGGMPVRAGEKWVATKWLREGPHQ